MTDTPPPNDIVTADKPAATENADLKAQLAALRAFTIKLQSGLLVLTWIFGLYIFLQVWRAHNELKAIRPQAAQIIEAGKRDDPAINQFVLQLAEYGRTHADFAPIMSKYGIQPPPATSAPPATVPAKPAAVTPAPATPPKK